MNENNISCAPADKRQTQWDSIDWVKAEVSVKKLQARIVKGSEGRQIQQGESLAVDADPLFLRKSLSRKKSYF